MRQESRLLVFVYFKSMRQESRLLGFLYFISMRQESRLLNFLGKKFYNSCTKH